MLGMDSHSSWPCRIENSEYIHFRKFRQQKMSVDSVHNLVNMLFPKEETALFCMYMYDLFEVNLLLFHRVYKQICCDQNAILSLVSFFAVLAKWFQARVKLYKL